MMDAANRYPTGNERKKFSTLKRQVEKKAKAKKMKARRKLTVHSVLQLNVTPVKTLFNGSPPTISSTCSPYFDLGFYDFHLFISFFLLFSHVILPWMLFNSSVCLRGI